METPILRWDDSIDRNLVISALQDGNVVVGTSDTVPGLVAPVTQAGFDALCKIKERDDKPFLVLISDVDMLSRYATGDSIARCQNIIQKCWPGPLTVIVNARSEVPACAQKNGTVAVRVPRHDGLRALAKKFNGVFSTSANKAGAQVPDSIEDIDRSIVEASAYVVAGQSGASLPSTILDCTVTPISVVRVGAYSLDELSAAAGKPIVVKS